MPYGTIKVDNITFDNGGTDKLLTVSGLFFSTSGALTVTGTISGGNVTAPTATFTTLTGTTTAGTTATFTSGSFTSVTGTTVTGTTANFTSGVFTTRVSGTTVTGTTANFTSGNFTSLSGTTTTVTSGVFSAGSATAPSVAVGTGTSNAPGIYSPGADQLAISTGGTGRLFVNAAGLVDISNTTADKLTLSYPGFGIGTFGVDSTGSLLFKADEANTQASSIIQFKIDGGEKVRIDSSGRLLVGTSSGTSVGITVGMQYGGINLIGGGGTWAQWGGEYGLFPYAGVGLGIATAAAIGFVGSTGGNIANINGTTGVYTPLSDARKKKDFEDSNVGLAEVLKLKPKLYRMLDDANDAPKELGFIAQEVKLLIPQAYVENKITEDNTFIGLQDRPIIAALVKGMQEQQAIITALEARLAALETA